MNTRKHINKIYSNGRAIAFAVLALLLIAGIIIDRENARADRQESTQSTIPNPQSPAKHYPDLDKVTIPPLTPSQYAEYTGFSLSFNKENLTPNYVAWELLGTETAGEAKRTNRFWQDKKVRNCPDNNDYKNSGYDRGHICPAADQKWSQEAMHDCFVFTNMTPQVHALNAGAWNTLEEKSRAWARRDSALVIIAGPVYTDDDQERIGQRQVRVPGMYFKVILAPYLQKPRAIGYLFPNMSAPGSLDQYATSVDQIEEITGFDFFSSLPDSIENIVEATYSTKEWNRR